MTIEGNTALIIGWSMDGYPILAPYMCADASCTSYIEAVSSWQLVNPNVENSWDQHAYVEGSGNLDECNGMTLPDGSYAYFATNTFPYFMGCYHGEVSGNAGGGQGGAGGRGPRP